MSAILSKSCKINYASYIFDPVKQSTQVWVCYAYPLSLTWCKKKTKQNKQNKTKKQKQKQNIVHLQSLKSVLSWKASW